MNIAIVNHKGGTGKTTTAVNLGSALSRLNKKVLLVDFDLQGNLSYSLNADTESGHMAEVILNQTPISDILIKREGMDIAPANLQLADAELSMLKVQNRQDVLKNVLAPSKDYDFIIIDCPPSLSLLTVNALNASDKVIIPIELDVLSIQGLQQILQTIGKIKKVFNQNLDVTGILAVKVDERRKLTYEVLDLVSNNFKVPVFNNYVRVNVRAAEAPSFGASVVSYSPKSNSAKDYLNVANELVKIYN